LIKQLKPGGSMIIPVGSRFMVQELLMVEKNDKGKVTTRQILPVKFVPLTGKH
jgi:protein-L-isoaspartate(D-aspartate) O-methyltransferase